MALAAGSVAGVAKAIEIGLARLIPLVIGLLASLIGLGGLSKKVMKIFKKIRKRIDMAVNKLLMKAKKAGRKLMAKLKGKGKKVKGEKDESDKEEHNKNLRLAIKDVQKAQSKEGATVESVRNALPSIKSKHDLKSLTFEKDGNHVYHAVAVINPTLPGPKEEIFTEAETIELNKTAKQFAKQIKDKEHQIKFNNDPEAYLTGKLQTGDIVESTATPGLEALAKEGGFDLVRGVHLRFVNSAHLISFRNKLVRISVKYYKSELLQKQSR